jgi:hypothetical protein
MSILTGGTANRAPQSSLVSGAGKTAPLTGISHINSESRHDPGSIAICAHDKMFFGILSSVGNRYNCPMPSLLSALCAQQTGPRGRSQFSSPLTDNTIPICPFAAA